MNSRTIILRLAIFCLLLTITLPAQDWWIFVPTNDVSFTISPERLRYRAGEQIILKYRITNISNAPLFVPRGQWEWKCPNNGSPHLFAWFENSSGQHFVGGWGGSCSGNPKTISERMSKEAILLKPDEYFDGTLQLDSTSFDLKLKPGEYRIEANLSGWTQERFTDAELSELARQAYRLLRGEIPASVRVILTP